MQSSRLDVLTLTRLPPLCASLTLHILRNLNWFDPKETSYRLLFDEGQSRSSVCVGSTCVVVVIETDEGTVVVGIVVCDPVDRDEETPEDADADADADPDDLLESAPPTPPPTAAPITTTVATARTIQNVFLLRPQMRRFEELRSWYAGISPAGFSAPCCVASSFSGWAASRLGWSGMT